MENICRKKNNGEHLKKQLLAELASNQPVLNLMLNQYQKNALHWQILIDWSHPMTLSKQMAESLSQCLHFGQVWNYLLQGLASEIYRTD
jgi:hypothetical protein